MKDSAPMRVETHRTEADGQNMSVLEPLRVSWERGCGAMVKNTFLEFPVTGDEEDPWLPSTLKPRRLQTDSVVEQFNGQIRKELKPDAVATLTSNLSCIGDRGLASLGATGVSTCVLPADQTEEASCRMPAFVTAFSTYQPRAARQMHDGDEPEPPPPTKQQDPGSEAEDSKAMDHRPLLPASLLSDPTEIAQDVKNPCSMADAANANSAVKHHTTVMLRQIPLKYTQQKLVREVNGAGFAGLYDFLYMPMDSRRRANRGFAFINFDSGDTAARFSECFHGKKARHFEAEVPLEVAPADIQGFEANAEHYLSGQAMRSDRDAMSQPLFLRTFQGMAVGAASKCTSSAGVPAAGPVWPAGAWQQQPSRLMRQKQLHQPMPPPSPSWQQPGPPQQRLPDTPRFCPFCGQQKEPQHPFCPYCGNRTPTAS